MLVNYDEPLFNHNLVLVSKKQIDFEFDNQNNIIFKFKTGLYKGKNKNELASTVGETANLGKMPEIIEEPIDNSVNPEPNPTPDPETGNNNGGSSNTGDSDSSNKPVVTQRDGNIEYNVSDDYYASLQNKSGIALIDSLFAIQKSSSRHVPGYDALFTTYRDAFVDKYYEKDGTVMDIYGENPNGPDPFNFEHGKYKDVGKDEGAGMNREHIVAQSWFGRSAPMRNDAHHVWPSDKKVNAMHGNYPFGTVTKAKYVSLNGTKIGVSEEDGGPVCEPIDIFKGDVARAFFYFAFTYRDKNLRANDSARRFFINTKNEINPKFLKTLLKWHHDDPVDQFDIDRNNGIAKHQVVRNPFTDYPELVDVIFNNKIDYTFINKGVALNFMPKN
ncbi:ribonuclease [[Mycoplasma] anseris]|uniref:Ribonuclease n=2 Tax=[Mycoplasma] anseris TaxID=92400 RepID=A0A2Z4NDZ9_9BACT|nr:ribonuclease [[Mycoplasma] anseris]